MVVHVVQQCLDSLDPAAGAQLLDPVSLADMASTLGTPAVCLVEEVGGFLETDVTAARVVRGGVGVLSVELEQSEFGQGGRGGTSLHLEYILVMYIVVNDR